MSFKDRKTLLIAAAAAVIVIVIAAVFLLPGGKKATDSEVISKRVKINLQNDTAETKAPAAPSTEVPAPRAEPVKEPQKVAVEPLVKPEVVKKEAKTELTVKEAKPEVKKASRAEPVKEAKKEPAPAKKTLKADKTEPKRKIETVEARVGKKKSSVAAKAAASKPWAINVASFPSLMDAQNLTSRLKADKFNAYITEFKKEGIKWYRVRVGFFSTKDEALKSGKKIQSKFRVETPWVVKPAKDEASEHIK